MVAIGDYSTSEVDTGYDWVDGKPIYKKSINFGTLPNATTKNVAHGISTIDKILDMFGCAVDASTVIPLPYANPTSSSAVALFRDGTNISIITGTNRTNYTYCYITLLYTKT